MGGPFFTSWPLWIKMTFVMACAIVVVLAIGCCKICFDKWRMRKYESVQKEKEKTPQMVEAGPVQEEDIPFGIRAIQSGIEVDGIWISNPNSPVPSSPVSPSSSTFLEAGSSKTLARSLTNSDIQPINLPHPVRDPYRRSPSPSSRDLPLPGRGLLSQQSPISENSLDKTSRILMDRPASEVSTPNTSTAGQRRAKVHSMPLESVLRKSSTLDALDGISPSTLDVQELSSTTNTPTDSSGSRGTSRQNSDSSDHSEKRPSYIRSSFTDSILQTHPEFLGHEPVGVPRRTFDPRTNLDLLQSHRLSHVAETGQLTPRVRRPGFSGEWASVALLPEADERSSSVSSTTRRNSRTPSPSPPSVATPATYQPTNPTTNDSSSTSSITPRLSPIDSPKSDDPETPRGYPPRSRTPETYQPTLPHQNSAEDLKRPRPAFQRNSHPQHQILRKVNSGFEILVPGTLSEAPTLTADDTADLERGEKRQSRKLQKKRRPQSEVRPSTVPEEPPPPPPPVSREDGQPV